MKFSRAILSPARVSMFLQYSQLSKFICRLREVLLALDPLDDNSQKGTSFGQLR